MPTPFELVNWPVNTQQMSLYETGSYDTMTLVPVIL